MFVRDLKFVSTMSCFLLNLPLSFLLCYHGYLHGCVRSFLQKTFLNLDEPANSSFPHIRRLAVSFAEGKQLIQQATHVFKGLKRLRETNSADFQKVRMTSKVIVCFAGYLVESVSEGFKDEFTNASATLAMVPPSSYAEDLDALVLIYIERCQVSKYLNSIVELSIISYIYIYIILSNIFNLFKLEM